MLLRLWVPYPLKNFYNDRAFALIAAVWLDGLTPAAIEQDLRGLHAKKRCNLLDLIFCPHPLGCIYT